MKLIGIDIKSPSPGELLGATLFIIFFVLMGMILHSFDLVPSGSIFPAVTAFSLGVILHALGVSISEHGWRAFLIIFVAGLAVFSVIQCLGF